ncbi:hypothetical protein JCM3765_005930 [Sporobolomyces pararoseus]
MDKLPDEVLEKIIRYYRDSPLPYRPPEVWMDKKRWSEEEERVRRASRAIEKRATLAALARSSKSLSRVTTPLLYERVHLDSRNRICKFRRTHTGHVSPWSRERKAAVNENCNAKSLCIDLSEESRPRRLPDLRLLDDLGHFARLQSLKLYNFLDPTDTIPDLLKPFSPIRSQLVELEIVRPEHLSAELTTAFVFELPLYIPEEAFVSRTKKAEQEANPGAEQPDERDLQPITRRLRKDCRTDYASFASLHSGSDEDHINIYDWPYDVESLKNPPGPPSPFIALTSLNLTISEDTTLRALLETPVVRNLKQMRLAGSPLIEEEHVILLRPSFTHTGGEDGYCKSPKQIEFDEDYPLTRIHRFLLAFLGMQEPWPGLEEDDLLWFGEYLGPTLEVLDLSDLLPYVCH